jgi:transcriptional regulator
MTDPVRAGDADRNTVWQGTLSLMILRTLQVMGDQHGYGIARRIEQTSGGRLTINYGTLYPALLKLEQEGLVSTAWGVSDHGRKAKFYRLTRAGRREIERERKQWEETAEIMMRFLVKG